MTIGEFMRTSYVTGEANELEPFDLNDDDVPIEIPTLNVNVGTIPSYKVIGKSSRPSRKRKREDSPVMLVKELKGDLDNIANAIEPTMPAA